MLPPINKYVFIQMSDCPLTPPFILPCLLCCSSCVFNPREWAPQAPALSKCSAPPRTQLLAQGINPPGRVRDSAVLHLLAALSQVQETDQPVSRLYSGRCRRQLRGYQSGCLDPQQPGNFGSKADGVTILRPVRAKETARSSQEMLS